MVADRITFGSLWVGDRFKVDGNLWTKLDHETARQHCKSSIALGERGHAYIGDAVCSFETEQEVEFVPPAMQISESSLVATVYVGKDKQQICWHGQLPDGVHHLFRVADPADPPKTFARVADALTDSPEAADALQAEFDRRRTAERKDGQQ